MGDDFEKLKKLNQLIYKDQAIWFLNAFWAEHGSDAEGVWNYTNKMIELDEKNGTGGNEIDEFTAHRFLEQTEDTMTVRELRETLREIDIDTNKMVSLTEYLIFHYKIDWHKLVNAAQSDNTEEIDRAQALLADALQKLGHARGKADEARKLETIQRQAEADAKKALALLKAEELAYENRRIDLERRTNEGGIVSRNKAKNELQQLLGEDPLPLRRAKINQGAAVRANERATAVAGEARKVADEALGVAVKAFEEAEAYLVEIRNMGGSGEGVLWWIDREITEAKKYLPQSKGGGR
uniref:TolA-like protein n=1 Tax=Hirondellea gigas TaxID=1518452 RepID=A0A2P2IEW5_9CRUS